VAEQNPESGRPGAAVEDGPRDSEQQQSPEAPQKKTKRRVIIIGVVALLIVVGLLFWWRSTFSEDTDDAQVSGHLIQLSSRISGQVLKINFTENQMVKKGDVLVEIDPRDYQVTVEQDEANLEAAEANYEAAKVNVPVTSIQTNSSISQFGATVKGSDEGIKRAQRQYEQAQAAVAQADANNIKAQQDLQRYTPLVAKDVISKQQFDQYVATARSAEAQLLEAKASAIAAEDQVGIARQQAAESQAQLRNAENGPNQVKIQKSKADQAAAQVEQSRAELDQARLNLSYTKIVAPADGIITKKSVEIADNVSVGQNLATLVSLEDVWITANFKETQLQHMQTGQAVKIHVDAYDRDYNGHVTQVGGATGSNLSLFPPENATGNYVKVVQRVPVRIDLDQNENQDHMLRPGLSVEPTVRVK
jgi:membrane fusion protein (multidrug efflux system)